MEYISFKRAKDFPGMELPDELIVQSQIGVIEGWDSLPEDDFRVEFSKNSDLLKAWLGNQAALEVAMRDAAHWENVVAKKEQKLFEEWKAKRGKK